MNEKKNKPDIEVMDDVLKFVADLSRHDHKKSIGIVIALVLDVILTFGIAYGAIHLHTVSNQSQIASCQVGNKFRRDEKKLWLEFLDVIQHPNPTPHQLQVQYIMHRDLSRTVLQRSCKNL